MGRGGGSIANRIEVWVAGGLQRPPCRDNGRGIPIDAHPKFPDKSALEVILWHPAFGRQILRKRPNQTSALHGVGIGVNALSDSMVVQVARNKTLSSAFWSRAACPQGRFKKIGAAP